MNIRTASLIASLVLLTACGGGGDGSGGGGTSGVSYKYTAPVQGQTQTYSVQVTDVAGHSATYTYMDTITQVNADGSYSNSDKILSGGTYTLDGANYVQDPSSANFDSAGRIIHYEDATLTPPQICNDTYPQDGRPSVVAQGQSWDWTQLVSCDNGAYQATQTLTTTFEGIESVTVPAGTFNAYKFLEIEKASSATDPAVYTYTTTNWINASATDSRLLKSTSQTAVSGGTMGASEIQASVMTLTAYQ